jgi:hypothetical protein
MKNLYSYIIIFLSIYCLYSCKKGDTTSGGNPPPTGVIVDTSKTSTAVFISNLNNQDNIVFSKNLTFTTTVTGLSKLDLYVDNKFKTHVDISTLNYNLIVDSLTDNSKHTVWARAFTTSGDIYDSKIVIFNSFTLTPYINKLTIIGNSTQISWQALATMETGFIIERKDAINTSYVPIATVGPAATANQRNIYLDATVNSVNKKYTYRVRGYYGATTNTSFASGEVSALYVTTGPPNFIKDAEMASFNLPVTGGSSLSADVHVSVKFSKDGAYFLLLAQDYVGGKYISHIEIWDGVNHSLIRTITQTDVNGADYAAVFSNDNQYIIAGGFYNSLRVYKTSDGSIYKNITHTAPSGQTPFRTHDMPCTSAIDINADGTLVAADEGSGVGIYNIATGALVRTISPVFTDGQVSKQNCDVRFDHSGSKIIIGQSHYISGFPTTQGSLDIQVYNYQTGLLDHIIAGSNTVHNNGKAGLFSYDDSKIITSRFKDLSSSSLYNIYVYDASSTTSSVNLAQPAYLGSGGRISADGSVVFSTSNNGINANLSQTGALLSSYGVSSSTSIYDMDYSPLTQKLIFVNNLITILSANPTTGAGKWYPSN